MSLTLDFGQIAPHPYVSYMIYSFTWSALTWSFSLLVQFCV